MNKFIRSKYRSSLRDLNSLSQWRSHDRSRERRVLTPCDYERFDKRRNLFQYDVNQTNFRTFANQTKKQ